MPLSNAVLDFHALGIVETPDGPRQRVVLVAAQRDMIQRLLAAVRDAGLRPEGIDLSAFALIRSLYRPDPEHSGRVLYLNVDGLTNMAIAEGTVCRFTRVVGGGIEAMASELAERRSIPLVEARSLIATVDLTVQPAPEPVAQTAVAEAEAELEPESAVDPEAPTAIVDEVAPAEPSFDAPSAVSPVGVAQAHEADVRTVLENGIREIAGEVRNSLDFHRSQEGGGEVARVVLSGAALDLPGFAEALQEQLGNEVERESVHLDGQDLGGISAHRLAIAAGLAVEEAPQ
jgi:type IV pilus assembly protein PilM